MAAAPRGGRLLRHASCRTLEEALRDPHFVGRGLFAHRVAGASGETMPALPLPIAPEFRARARRQGGAGLGSDSDDILATAPRPA